MYLWLGDAWICPISVRMRNPHGGPGNNAAYADYTGAALFNSFAAVQAAHV